MWRCNSATVTIDRGNNPLVQMLLNSNEPPLSTAKLFFYTKESQHTQLETHKYTYVFKQIHPEIHKYTQTHWRTHKFHVAGSNLDF